MKNLWKILAVAGRYNYLSQNNSRNAYLVNLVLPLSKRSSLLYIYKCLHKASSSSSFTRLSYFFLSVRKKSKQLIFFFSLILRTYLASGTPNFKLLTVNLLERWNRKWLNFYNHANFHYRKSETQWITELESTLYGLQRPIFSCILA